MVKELLLVRGDISLQLVSIENSPKETVREDKSKKKEMATQLLL